MEVIIFFMFKEVVIFLVVGSGNCRGKINIEIVIFECINKER